VEPLSDIPRHWYVLVIPPYGSSTAAVYAALSLTSPPQEVMPFLRTLECRPGEGAVRCFNRLESAAFPLEPRLGRLRQDLERRSGVAWTMTGSGSVLFSVVGTENQARRVASAVTHGGSVEVMVTRGRYREPPITR